MGDAKSPDSHPCDEGGFKWADSHSVTHLSNSDDDARSLGCVAGRLSLIGRCFTPPSISVTHNKTDTAYLGSQRHRWLQRCLQSCWMKLSLKNPGAMVRLCLQSLPHPALMPLCVDMDAAVLARACQFVSAGPAPLSHGCLRPQGAIISQTAPRATASFTALIYLPDMCFLVCFLPPARRG